MLKNFMLIGRRWSCEQSAIDDIASSRARRFPKILFALSRCRIIRAKSSGDLLSRSSVHADVRDEVGYDDGATTRTRQNSSLNRYILWCSQWVRYIGESHGLINFH